MDTFADMEFQGFLKCRILLRFVNILWLTTLVK